MKRTSTPTKSMRLLLISLFGFTAMVLHAIPAIAGTVSILPMSPALGSSVTIEYNAAAGDEEMVSSGTMHAVAYLFTVDAESPEAVDVSLSKKSERWTGTFQLPTGVVYGIVKVGTGGRYDTNKDMFWEFLVTKDGSRHVEGAHLKAAMARFGQLPAPCKMKEDVEEALELLNKESRLYPGNLVAQLNYIMVAKAVGELDEFEANGKYRDLTTSVMQIKTPIEAIVIAQAYAAQGKNEEANRVMADGATRFPKSIAAEQYELEQIGKAETLNDFIQRVLKHFELYPSTSARQNITDAVTRATTQQGALRELIMFLDQHPKASAKTYHQAVNFIGASDSLRSEAYRLIADGLRAADDPTRRPRNVGVSEWNYEQRISRSLLLFVKGAIERAQNRPEDAITSLEKSIEISGTDAEKGCREMLIDLYRSTGKTKKALAMASAAIVDGASTAGITNAYRELLRSNGEDSLEIAAQEAKLRSQGRKAMAKKVQQEFLNQTAINGTFTRLDGSAVRISDWKGKVVIIDYWATWCGPCRQSFPSLQKLYERYRNDTNVVIAVVNVWERTDDRVKTVKDFLAKNTNLTFPMFLDKDDSVVRNYGVTGIPTKFYLGKDGRIQFKEVGLHPEEQFLEEATTRIEALLAQ
ncbi:MAG: redoxin domain-containing protein [Candidatus Kapabacteria bacterium]|nr:redoxin domain-containing protein [Candidatus Kapabacteria bacterium]